MIGIELQISGLRIGILIGIGLSLVSVILGIIITYIAFQGYRRNSSRPMLFVAVGFLFVFVIPILISAGPSLVAFLIVTTGRYSGLAPLIARASTIVGVIVQAIRVIGLLSILYGLRMPLRR